VEPQRFLNDGFQFGIPRKGFAEMDEDEQRYKAPMDRVHVFTSSPPGNWGFSLDLTGANLPTGTGFTYTHWKTINLQAGDPLIASDQTDIIAALQDRGWCIIEFRNYYPPGGGRIITRRLLEPPE
jgi:hypothetical protein